MRAFIVCTIESGNIVSRDEFSDLKKAIARVTELKHQSKDCIILMKEEDESWGPEP